ncbi:MAG: hypothetical protein ABUK01_09035 [Leptospirales bacterium]
MNERPTWATVIGILGIIVASFGMLGGMNEIITPSIMKLQEGIFNTVEKGFSNIEMPSGSQSKDNPFTTMTKKMKDIFQLPPWFATYSITSGILKLLLCGLYLFASIGLLQMKPASIRLFYIATGSSIILNVVKGIIAVSALSFLGGTMIVLGSVGVVIDIVFIAVVASGNKEGFI